MQRPDSRYSTTILSVSLTGTRGLQNVSWTGLSFITLKCIISLLHMPITGQYFILENNRRLIYGTPICSQYLYVSNTRQAGWQ